MIKLLGLNYGIIQHIYIFFTNYAVVTVSKCVVKVCRNVTYMLLLAFIIVKCNKSVS